MPDLCGNIGTAPPPTQPRVHGRRADLYDYCDPSWHDPVGPTQTCTSPGSLFILGWQERGTELMLTATGPGKAQVLAIARGLVLAR